jgi:hypothetical protein
MELSKQQNIYVQAIIEHAPANGVAINKVNFSRAELRLISMSWKGKKWIPNWITHDLSRRVDRGVFSIPEVMDALNVLNVSPGHETDGDSLADATETHAPDVTHVVSDDMGEHTVSDDMLHHVVESS